MAWQIELSAGAEKALSKMDRQNAKRITSFLRERVGMSDDPRATGKSLTGPLSGYWRYRVGDYRILCEIQDARILVFVLSVGHRGDVYR